ncbi:Gfo/Idh/MocA family protein [Gulosibacter chungangensis]|uniref:Gfo/Idh/MocA family oxidoreductase n=1 Tax=Gulosibacter chungangensis TaxID=979746 RepID=A0A7J5BG90_9MICO|nr:Gfo/Idh/MocA family oxidoreductase [Gulosibacter chungangensis]KAB1645296.1 Gfo/Idh/MocA family oxidoreductase [Gulosibacter chungangensis]
MQKTLKVALVGAGMAGQAHAFGYRNATMADDLRGLTLELDTVADVSESLAEDVRLRYGFRRATTDITEIANDPEIDIISVALPNHAHREVLEVLLASGKHVLTEKPLGVGVEDAEYLTALSKENSGTHAVGFSYRRIPALAQMAKIVREGQLGDIWHFESSYYSDHAAATTDPFTWRFDRATAGGGALSDLGAHAVDAIAFVISPIADVLSAHFQTSIPERRDRAGEPHPVTNDDFASALVRTESGATGSLLTSRVAYGQPNRLALSVYGSKGSAHFDTQHYNDLQVFQAGGDAATTGPSHVVMGPANPHYADVSSFRSRGVNTGYGEAFIAEIQDFIRAVLGLKELDTTFDNALHAMRVIDAMYAFEKHTVR